MDRIELETTLPVGAAEAANLFWDIGRWQRVWNPIQQVAVTYDDGRLQEFAMDLHWHGRLITIRTVRLRASNGDIEFFSPNPPGEFGHHTGCWRFAELAPDRCRLSAIREFVVRREAHETVDVYGERREQVRSAFRLRLIRILDAFQTHVAHASAASAA
jgi:hypothetical protein